jgi:RNA polymerase sigma factor (sigma-70 family)
MTKREFEKYYKRYSSIITAIARKYAGADADLFDDLVSAGTIGLWEIDLRRPFKNEDAFIRQIIRNKVIDHLRWLAPDRFKRLDRFVAQGDQIIKDEITGEVTLVRHDRRSEARSAERPRYDSGDGARSTDEDEDG